MAGNRGQGLRFLGGGTGGVVREESSWQVQESEREWSVQIEWDEMAWSPEPKHNI